MSNTYIQLNLISCPNLEKIDGLCGLAKLQMLNISGWRKVEELAGIETLVSLEELRASVCEKLKRIRGLGQLTKLKLLDVHGCSEIEELEGVEHLRSLEKLDASDCPGLHWDARVLEQLPQRLKEGMLYI
jgi:internalin A